MQKKEIRSVRILGSGTSTGVPEVGCYCSTCLSTDPADKRTRTSVLLETNEGKKILLDCSPDFRQQAILAEIDELDSIVLSHEHYDHIAGLDDLRTIAWARDLPIYAENRVLEAIRYRLHYYFGKTPYLGTPRLKLREISLAPFEVEGLTFEPIRVFHGRLPITGFRIGDFAFITDLKTIPNEEVEKLRGVDTLLVNGLRFTKPHPTHQTIEEAIALSKEVKARNTFIIHLSHHAPRAVDLAKMLPEGVFASYDGLRLERINDHLEVCNKTNFRASLAPHLPYEFRDCRSIPYAEAYALQKELFQTAIEQKHHGEVPKNTLLFCEHEPVFTLGKHGKESNLLLPEEALHAKGISLHHIDRGGDITYHGPGQITGYPIFDLEQFGMGIKQYIYTLEQCIIDVLRVNGIHGERLEGATGVWIEPNTPQARKICAIGVHSSRYITLHGFALNVFTDLSYFSWINPCGFTNKGVTSIAQEMGKPTTMELVKQQVEEAFHRHFFQAYKQKHDKASIEI